MSVREKLLQGHVIPAHPLALTAERKLDERRQSALTRYYLSAGAGGIAVGVHTTQFAIREAGLLKPILELAQDEIRGSAAISIAGVCGPTVQAVREAELARSCGYDALLLSLAALSQANNRKLIEHSQAVADVLPVIGFYLQPAVGGRVLSFEFWRRFVEIENVVAIKIAPFNRYQTLDVIRAVAASGRAGEIALYTGNDDSIVIDLLTGYDFSGHRLKIAGGLLGQWAVWTRKAVNLFRTLPSMPFQQALTLNAQITDANSAIFDAANGFRGCIAGVNEILRRQGLLAGRWCLNPDEDLSAGQLEEIERVYQAYPHLNDDEFVRTNLDLWMK